MMNGAYDMTVSPDFTPKYTSGWFIFNTWLQKALDTQIHLEMYHDFASQRRAIAEDRVDIIYANPFDASMLVREKGFVPVAKPAGKSDECIVAVLADSPTQVLEDLHPGTRVACTDDPDVNLMGMIMLEPADLDRSNVQTIEVGSYPLVAKLLLQGAADVGFFLEEAFEEFSAPVRSQLRPLVRSQITDIRHVMLVGPRLAERREGILQALVAMPQDPKSASVLGELGFMAWEPMEQEDTEFMIDLMDTLKA